MYYEISEIEIRKLLDTLGMKDMIKISKGRGGNSVLPKGIDFLINNRYIDKSIEEEYISKMKKTMSIDRLTML